MHNRITSSRPAPTAASPRWIGNGRQPGGDDSHDRTGEESSRPEPEFAASPDFGIGDIAQRLVALHANIDINDRHCYEPQIGQHPDTVLGAGHEWIKGNGQANGDEQENHRDNHGSHASEDHLTERDVVEADELFGRAHNRRIAERHCEGISLQSFLGSGGIAQIERFIFRLPPMRKRIQRLCHCVREHLTD